MNRIQDDFYRGSQANTTKQKRKLLKNAGDNLKSVAHSQQKINARQQFTRQIEQAEENAENEQIKSQNNRLKKMLKEAQTKRTQITRECSELTKKIEILEEENQELVRRLKDGKEVNQNQKYRIQELRFLNKELSTEIEQLRNDNQELNEKLRYQTQILERKYEDLEERTFKRIQQAMKRVKKGIHYLGNLSAKQIQKTKDIQVQNLKKTVQILRGKYNQDKYQEQIEELMNPIKNIQVQLHATNKQLHLLKDENAKLEQEIKKHKKVERQLMPQYREAIQKLKKNLYQLRSQLSENEYDKSQIKLKYEEKLKDSHIKYDELFKQHRKLKLENKIYQKKLEQMEADVQQEKQRLQEENQLLKKLYEKQSNSEIDDLNIFQKPMRTEAVSHKTLTNARRPEFSDEKDFEYQKELIPRSKYDNFAHATIEQSRPKFLKKNFSTSNLRESGFRMGNKIENNQEIEVRKKKKFEDRSRNKYDHLRLSRNSSNNLKSSRQKNQPTSYKRNNKLELSDYYDQNDADYMANQQSSSSMISQDGLKNEIFKIDRQIMEIQKTLAQELELNS